MASNRLEIILSAKMDDLNRGFRQAEQFAKKTGKNIAGSFTDAGTRAEKLGDSVSKASAKGEASLKNLGDQAERTGDDLEGGFDGADSAIDRLIKEFRDLRQEISKLGDSSAEVAELQRDLKGVEDGLRDAGSAAKAINLQTALQSAESLLGKLNELSSTFTDTAATSRDMERSIKQAFSNPADAQKFVDAARDLKDAYGELVEEDDIGQAVKRLDALSATSEANLGRITKAALDAGKDLSDAADTFGEALAPLESGNFDIGVFEELRAQYGIGGEALRQYGAELDSTGKILGDTVDQQRAAQRALQRYLDENDRYANIANRARDAQSELSDEVGKFKREVGDSVNDLKDLAAKGLLPVAKALNNLPEGFIQFTAGLALTAAPLGALAVGLGKVASLFNLVGSGGSIGAAGVEKTAGAFGNLSGKLTNVLPRLKSFATGAGGSAVVLGALALAAYKTAEASSEWVDALEDADKAQAALIQTQARAIKKDREILEVRKESIAQIKAEVDATDDLAKARNKATRAVLEAQDSLSSAESSGDRDAIQAAQRRLDEARRLRVTVDQRKKAEVEAEQAAEKATQARYRQASNDFQEYKSQVDAGNFDSAKKQLQAFESIFSRLDSGGQKEAIGALRSLRQSVLNDELANLKKRLSAEEVTAEKARSIQARLLAQFKANADQKAKAEEDLSDSIQAIQEKRLQRTRALQAKELDLQKQALAQRAELAKESPELTALQRRLEKGEDVLGLIKAETAAQNEKLQAILKEEAALERLRIQRERAAEIQADPANADQINKQAAEQERQLNERLAAERNKLNREVAEKNRDYEEKAKKAGEARQKREAELALKTAEQRASVLDLEKQAQADVFEERRRQLREVADLGADTSAELAQIAKEEGEAQLQAVQDRLKAEKEIIALKQAQANVGASTEQKVLNDQAAALELQRAQREARKQSQAIIDKDLEKLQAYTAQLEEQKKLLEDQNKERRKAAGFSIESDFGGVSGVDNINSFGEGFGKSNLPSQQKKDADGKTPADIDRQIQLNQAKLAQLREKARTSTPPIVPDGNSRQAAPGATPGTPGGLSQADSANLAATAANIAKLPGLIQNLSAAIQQQAKAANLAPNNFAASMTRRTENTLI